MAPPSDKEITRTLQRIVRDALRSDEEITVNLARSRAEAALELDEGFLKNDSTWKGKSKDIISAAVEDAENGNDDDSFAVSSHSAKTGDKRKSPDVKSAAPKRTKRTPSPADDVEYAEVKNNYETAKQDVVAEDDGAESDYSSVIDEPAPKKQRKSKPKAATTTNGKSAATKTSTNTIAGKTLSADEEEIKRLQGWLLKCGVRKLWHRELANCTTTKDKIRHLKGLLQDVGMTGRYSADKAKQIKEARELAEELEAAKEFNDKWGQGEENNDDDDDDESGSGSENGNHTTNEKAGGRNAKRGLPKGLVDFGDSGDEGSD